MDGVDGRGRGGALVWWREEASRAVNTLGWGCNDVISMHHSLSVLHTHIHTRPSLFLSLSNCHSISASCLFPLSPFVPPSESCRLYSETETLGVGREGVCVRVCVCMLWAQQNGT